MPAALEFDGEGEGWLVLDLYAASEKFTPVSWVTSLPTEMTDDVEQQYGLLAAKFGKRQLPLQVCKSAMGFYLGTLAEDGTPFSRESDDYWRTRKEADRALTSRDWTQRLEL